MTYYNIKDQLNNETCCFLVIVTADKSCNQCKCVWVLLVLLLFCRTVIKETDRLSNVIHAKTVFLLIRNRMQPALTALQTRIMNMQDLSARSVIFFFDNSLLVSSFNASSVTQSCLNRLWLQFIWIVKKRDQIVKMQSQSISYCLTMILLFVFTCNCKQWLWTGSQCSLSPETKPSPTAQNCWDMQLVKNTNRHCYIC